MVTTQCLAAVAKLRETESLLLEASAELHEHCEEIPDRFRGQRLGKAVNASSIDWNAAEPGQGNADRRLSGGRDSRPFSLKADGGV